MANSGTVKVDLGTRSYDIVVGSGILRSSGELIKKQIKSRKVIIITDSNVAKAGHLKTLEGSLKKIGVASESITLKPGEQTKSFKELESLLNKLLSMKPDRGITLIALGGGVVGDITGFAASILLRGVNFIQVPTTLLAMVDSSVGGKTGINTKHGKNLIGTFYQPKLVIADLDLLKTLPKREFLAGYAEVVKYGLINNPKFFSRLEKVGKNLGAEDVIQCCKSKAEIVSSDEKEAGQRALLNLGHTFGHALEAETGFSDRLLHGEGVAIGMVMAFEFSAELGICSSRDARKVEKHLQTIGLPTSPSDIKGMKFSEKDLLSHMKQDKKAQDGKLTFVLVKGIGQAFVQKNVDESKVLKFLKSVL